MADTPSNMIPLGTQAPSFSLYDTISGKTLNLDGLKGKKGTVIMFICNHCPFVKHVNPQIVQLSRDYSPREVGFIAISSNDILRYPQDAPGLMKEMAIRENYPFPYLYDETQEVARAYDAACTPDFYLFDADLRLVYRGQLDDSRPGRDIASNGKDLRNALDALLSGNPVNPDQKPSIGCNIKWRE